MKKVNLEELRKQLLEKIDTTDLLQVKKVNNLIRLYELDAECDEAIDRDGVSIVIENGSQRFIKSHPSMNEKMKINSQIIALEKTIEFKPETLTPSSSSSVEEKAKRGSLI